jgi:hypothetical protein
MKESKLYINFFKKNLLLILIPTLTLPLFVHYGTGYYTKLVSIERILEVKSSTNNTGEGNALADQAVKLLRSENIYKQLNLSSEISVYKYAPAILKLEVSGQSSDQVKKDLSLINELLNSRYTISPLGEDIEDGYHVGAYVFPLLSIGTGFLLGVVLSLIKEYFKFF